MTYAACLADAQDLKAIMNRWGVKCSIELVAGRGSDPWATPTKYVRMHHHTASWYVPGGNMTPVLGLVKKGRADLTGPLANGYGGFDLIYRIICMGLANHSGLGGPITIDGVYIPKDSGRGPTWGTEWEGGYQDYENIPGMMEFMGKADNALAEWSHRQVTSQMEHSTWAPDRKIDRRKFTRARGIELTRRYSATPAPTPTPPAGKKAKMLYLVKCDDRPHVFVTDWITARHIWHWDEVGLIRWCSARAGQPISTADAEGNPIILKDLEQKKLIDRLAKTADVDPKYPYQPHT